LPFEKTAKQFAETERQFLLQIKEDGARGKELSAREEEFIKTAR